MITRITGLAALLDASAIAFQTITYPEVAHLLYVALQTWHDRTPLTADVEIPSQSAWTIIRAAVLINILNPKLTIFFFALLPRFVATDQAGATWHMVVLSLVFIAATLIVFALRALRRAAIRTYVISRPPVVTWIRRPSRPPTWLWRVASPRRSGDR